MLHLTRRAAAGLAAALILTIGSACVGTSVPPAAPAAQVEQAPAGPAVQRLSTASRSIDAALAALDAGDLEAARLHYGAYDDAWDAIEDDIRDPHPDVYEAVERAMDRVDDMLLKVDDPSPAVAAEALRALRQTIDAQMPRLG